MKPLKREESSPEEPVRRAKIDFEEIARLLNLIEEKNLTRFELEVEGFKIRVAKEPPSHPMGQLQPWPASSGSQGLQPASPSSDSQLQPETQENFHYITSPMVGTFYRAPDPTSPPFVEVGDVVKKKQTLCIIEAMKLMNEIESDIDGVVKEIYVENGKPVEYGQRLFAIQPLS